MPLQFPKETKRLLSLTPLNSVDSLNSRYEFELLILLFI